MKYYYKCFNKSIELSVEGKKRKKLDFWLQRFCPNVQIDISKEKLQKIDYQIVLKYKEKYDYEIINDNKIIIYGKKDDYSSYLAKFVTQVFQNLLIDDEILFFPAACVSCKNKCLLIIGDYWQGKTSTSMYLSSNYNYNLISDNYVAVKDEYVIGATKYISIRKEDRTKNINKILEVNDRIFSYNKKTISTNLKVNGFILPYINSSNNNIHFISKEESKWYLYQKLTRLINGESILFNGKLPSPSYIDKRKSIIILNIVNKLLEKKCIKYVSADMTIIAEECIKTIEGIEGEELNE